MPARTGRPWRRLRDRIIRRDGGICHLCGQPGADSADHIVAVAHGGALYDPTNLAAVHHDAGARCNRVRGSRSIEQARTSVAPEPQGWDW